MAQGARMERRHDLDALRGVAMSLGVVLHATIFLTNTPIFWPVQDLWVDTVDPRRNPYNFIMMGIHGFRMPLFFLLSGYFTAMLWQLRGWRHLLMHRLKRIGLPLVLGVLTVVPVAHWLFRGPFHLASWPIIWWLGGFQHLWFLWQLLMLAGLFLLVTRLGLQFRHATWWLLMPLTLLPIFLMEEHTFGADTSEGVIPDPRVLGYYALYFFFGAFFYQRAMVVSRWWAAVLPFTVTVVFLTGMTFLFPDALPPSVRNARETWIAAVVLQAAYAWLMCFGMMGLFRWIASKERYWVRYLSDASYWIYLGHLVLVLIVQEVLVDLAFNVHLKFLVVCLVVPGILLILYEWGVRYTWIGTMLNGKRVRARPGLMHRLLAQKRMPASTSHS